MTAKPTDLQQDFTLQGTLIKSELEEDGSSIYVHLKLQFYLTNITRDSLLFRKQDRPIFIGLALSKTPRFEQGDLIEKYVGGPSIDNSDKWRLLRESLDTNTPSETVVRKLAPNEMWSFVEEATIVTARKPGLQNQLTLEKLRATSPFWMKVFFEVWSPNIEPNVDRRSDLGFGKTLRKRWSKYGHLFLDDISSAPMMVDLSAPTLDSKEKPPKVISAVKPAYPAIAAARRINGKVTVDVEIDRNGLVTETRASGGHCILQKAAQDAAMRWRFDPTSQSEGIRRATLSFTFLKISSLNVEDGFRAPYQMIVRWEGITIASQDSREQQVGEEIGPWQKQPPAESERWLDIAASPLGIGFSPSKRDLFLLNRADKRVIQYVLGCATTDPDIQVLRQLPLVTTSLEPGKALINSVTLYTGDSDRCISDKGKLIVVRVVFEDNSSWQVTP